jgi:uncharacterized protein YcbX
MFVAQLWRYPVKSMGGERLEAVGVAPRTGLDGDRTFALIDGETGTVVSAKYPRRWGALLEYTARLDDGRLVIETPGRRIGEREMSAYFTEQLGRRVLVSATPSARPAYQHLQPTGAVTVEHLADAAPNTFFDHAPVHVVSTASLRRLASVLPKAAIDIVRFRPNLVIDTGDAEDFVENGWENRRLVIGDTVVLEVAAPCARCVMTTLAQRAVPDDPTIASALTRLNDGVFGMYAQVIAAGEIRERDPIRLS